MHVHVACLHEWLPVSQPEDIRYVFLQSLRLTPDPFSMEGQGARLLPSSSSICTLAVLMPAHLCCLSTVELISSLSPTEKKKIPAAPCTTLAQRGKKPGPSWSTTQSQLGVIDSPILRRSNTLVAWSTGFKITCHSRRGSRGGVEVTFQVDVGGTVKA